MTFMEYILIPIIYCFLRWQVVWEADKLDSVARNGISSNPTLREALSKLYIKLPSGDSIENFHWRTFFYVLVYMVGMLSYFGFITDSVTAQMDTGLYSFTNSNSKVTYNYGEYNPQLPTPLIVPDFYEVNGMKRTSYAPVLADTGYTDERAEELVSNFIIKVKDGPSTRIISIPYKKVNIIKNSKVPVNELKYSISFRKNYRVINSPSTIISGVPTRDELVMLKDDEIEIEGRELLMTADWDDITKVNLYINPVTPLRHATAEEISYKLNNSDKKTLLKFAASEIENKK